MDKDIQDLEELSKPTQDDEKEEEKKPKTITLPPVEETKVIEPKD